MSGGGGVSKRENNLFGRDMMRSLKRMRKHDPLKSRINGDTALCILVNIYIYRFLITDSGKSTVDVEGTGNGEQIKLQRIALS
jgi:hypothetical protein